MTSHDLARILSANSAFELREEFGSSPTLLVTIKDAIAAKNQTPKRVLPRDLAMQGKYAVSKKYNPKVGDDIDFYDRTGSKRYGIIARISRDQIWIETLTDCNESLKRQGVIITHQFEMVEDTI